MESWANADTTPWLSGVPLRTLAGKPLRQAPTLSSWETAEGPGGCPSRPLWELPDEIPRKNSTDKHSPVTEQEDQLTQVLELQSVVQCEAKAVSSMKQQQRAGNENCHSGK